MCFRTIAIATLLLTPIALVAQDFRLGFKLGGNLSTLGTENAVVEKQVRTGYHIGFSGAFEWEEFGFQPELLYSTQGAEIALPGLIYEEQYDYLNLPVVLKFYIGKGFNVHFGPYFAYLLKATQRETSGFDQTEYNIDEFISDTDYGFLGGFGYDLLSGFNFEIRYNYGMKDVDSQQNIERRNRVFQLSGTYFFVK